jgi:hypothetical protein
MDLVRGRLKLMNTSWFADLSLPTRTRFFHNLLVDLLGEQPDQQRAILASSPFTALPGDAQAYVLRMVASHHLSKQQNIAFALDCLRRSLDLQPHSLRGRMLLRLARHSPALTAAALAGWQRGRRVVDEVCAWGRPRPRPVPTALLPKTE